MLHAQLAALALATTALVATGCGSTSKQSSNDGSVGASTSTATTTPTTTAARTTKTASGKPITAAESILVAKASAICERVKARHRSMRLPTKEDLAREIPRFASFQQAAFAELSRLTPPASMAHEWKEFVASTRLLANDTTKLGEYFKANHFSGFGRFVIKTDKDELAIRTLAKHDAITGLRIILRTLRETRVAIQLRTSFDVDDPAGTTNDVAPTRTA